MNQTPKEKAEELFNKFRNAILSFLGDKIQDRNAKRCALIAVNEILQTFNNEWTKLDFWTEEINGTINFWQEVKKEIENL